MKLEIECAEKKNGGNERCVIMKCRQKGAKNLVNHVESLYIQMRAHLLSTMDRVMLNYDADISITNDECKNRWK